MQHREQLVAARQSAGRYDYTPCFALVKPQIEAADLAIANLETTLGGKPYTGYPAFSSPDEYLYAIRDAGFDVLLTANNHSLDRRQKGLERTLLMLDSLRIPHLGTYRNEEERSEHYPLFIRKKGFRLALLNYTYGTNGIEVTPPNMVNYIDKRVMQQDIRKAKAWQPDVIIACMHWGNEYQTRTSTAQRELADWLFEQGVTHIIGSHPHVLQPIEWRTDSCTQSRQVVVYSLGNFISNMSKVNTDGGMMFTLVLEKDTTQTVSPEVRVSESRYDLVWTARPALSKQRNYVLYPADSTAVSTLPPAARQRFTLFERNARAILKRPLLKK
jgi:poly-gamma-glutamate synthesis protein (capsule biosynthesis protein)